MSIAQGQQAVASDMNSMVPIGVPLPFFGSATYLPADHLILDGSTIGDASSGSTARANADTQTLFTLLWNSIANTELIIQTSGGSPTTRGASASADFAAHKRMPLPDMRGYTMGGYKSGDANFGTLGKQVGEATHKLVVAELASHRHRIWEQIGSAGSYSAVNIPSVNSMQYLDVSSYASTPLIENSGGDTPHNNIQPTITINWIIRYRYYA